MHGSKYAPHRWDILFTYWHHCLPAAHAAMMLTTTMFSRPEGRYPFPHPFFSMVLAWKTNLFHLLTCLGFFWPWYSSGLLVCLCLEKLKNRDYLTKPASKPFRVTCSFNLTFSDLCLSFLTDQLTPTSPVHSQCFHHSLTPHQLLTFAPFPRTASCLQKLPPGFQWGS